MVLLSARSHTSLLAPLMFSSSMLVLIGPEANQLFRGQSDKIWRITSPLVNVVHHSWHSCLAMPEFPYSLNSVYDVVKFATFYSSLVSQSFLFDLLFCLFKQKRR